MYTTVGHIGRHIGIYTPLLGIQGSIPGWYIQHPKGITRVVYTASEGYNPGVGRVHHGLYRVLVGCAMGYTRVVYVHPEGYTRWYMCIPRGIPGTMLGIIPGTMLGIIPGTMLGVLPGPWWEVYYPGMLHLVPWWVYIPPYYAHPPSSRVYHGAHSPPSVRASAPAHAEVSGSRALGSTLGDSPG